MYTDSEIEALVSRVKNQAELIDLQCQRLNRISAESITEKKAREILGDRIKADDFLHDSIDYFDWNCFSDYVCIDCDISIEVLEAIVWWMKNKKRT